MYYDGFNRQDDTLRNVVRVEKGSPELNAIEGRYDMVWMGLRCS
jgi:hypothetical protein